MSMPPDSERRHERHASAPESADTGESAVTAGREQRRMFLFVAAMLAFGAVCWFAYPHVSSLTKVWLGRRQLAGLRQHLKDQNWQAASEALREARRWAPEDPEVLHASLEFIALVGGDPRSTLSLIRRLQEHGGVTTDDLILMAKMHAQLGEIAKANDIYAQLPPGAREKRQGLELYADLLKAAGRNDEAAEVRRTALLSSIDEPASLQQLAVMDLNSTDPSRRSAMKERLWQIARSGGAQSLMAIELLAKSRGLTVPQSDELFRMIETAPATAIRREEIRLAVVSTRLRLNPHLRTELIDQEVMLWKNRAPAQIVSLVNWLSIEHEYPRLLRMVPAQTAAHYTDLLPAYVDALCGAGQWKELNALLTTGGIDAAFSPQKIRLWQVEAQIHLHTDPTQARQTLLRIYEEAGRGDDLPVTVEAGTLAEQLNQWDLAEKCYEAVATKHANARQTMLAKVYQMADYQHDGPGMLHACTRLLTLKPESHLILTQKLYLQLLLGIELELAQQQLQSGAQDAAEGSDRLHLLQALAAYRAGQQSTMQEHLRQVAKPEAFAVGLRSVYAALLKSSGGDAGLAFRLVERVSPVVLLPEERVFLQRAF
ncbi:MAG: hypothetical protein JWR15_4167 [Prosthecobacter sp.]|nr:hypothetical protein [Prosthecobacter sp.]